MSLPNKLKFVVFLINSIPNLLESIKFSEKKLEITVKQKNISNVLNFLKHNNKTQFKQLIDLCAIDFLSKKPKRFCLVYNLLSVRFGFRILVRTSINDLETIESASVIFKSAN